MSIPSLVDVLMNYPAKQLQAIVERRSLLIKNVARPLTKRTLVDAMLEGLRRPENVYPALSACNLKEASLLQLMVAESQKGPFSINMMKKWAAGPTAQAALMDAYNALKDLALVYDWHDQSLLPEMLFQYILPTFPQMHPIARALSEYDNRALQCITSKLDTMPGNKVAMGAAIAERLLDDGPHIVTSLGPDEKFALSYLTGRGGFLPIGALAAGIGVRADDFYRYDWQQRWKNNNFRNCIDVLLAHGLVYVANDSGFQSHCYIPGDLLEVLEGRNRSDLWIQRPPEQIPLKEPVMEHAHHGGIVRDTVQFLAYIRTHQAPRTSTSHIHKTDLKNVARLLSLPGDRYAGFIYSLCRAMELIRADGENGIYTVSPGAAPWLELPASQQRLTLFNAWRVGTDWREMEEDPLPDRYYHESTLIWQCREAALRSVGYLGDEYLEIESAAQVFEFNHPLAPALARSTMVRPVRDSNTYLQRVIGECLYWLGLADLTYNQPAGPASPASPGKAAAVPARTPRGYRLTPDGAFLLRIPGAQPPPESPEESDVVLQANSEIFLPPFIKSDVGYQIMLFADPPGKGAPAGTLMITAESLRRGLDSGLTQQAILEMLQRVSRTGVPQNVEYLIRDTAGKHGHIHVGKAGLYVRTNTPLLLQELAGRKDLAAFTVVPITENVAVLQADDVDKVMRALRKAGYLPVSDQPAVLAKPTARESSTGAKRAASPYWEVYLGKRNAEINATAAAKIDWDTIASKDAPPST